MAIFVNHNISLLCWSNLCLILVKPYREGIQKSCQRHNYEADQSGAYRATLISPKETFTLTTRGFNT